MTVSVRIAWWFTWIYVPLLAFGISLGLEPNPEKLSRAVRRAVKAKAA